jgi:hypothetical protein
MLPFAFWKQSGAGPSGPAPFYDPYIDTLWFRSGYNVQTVAITNPRSEQVSIDWTLAATPAIFYAPTPDPMTLLAGQTKLLRIERSLNANGVGTVDGVWTGAVSGATGDMPRLHLESNGSTPTP